MIILLGMVSCISLYMMSRAELFLRQASSFKAQVLKQIFAEEQLNTQRISSGDEKAEEKWVFIPDHLEFRCKTGTYLSRNENELYASKTAMRLENNLPAKIQAVKTRAQVAATQQTVLAWAIKAPPPSLGNAEDKHKNYLDFRTQYQHRPSILLALLQDPDPTRNAVLCQCDAETGETRERYVLDFPVTEGELKVEELYLEGEWCTLLILITQSINAGNQLLIWDITAPDAQLEHTLVSDLHPDFYQALAQALQPHPELNILSTVVTRDRHGVFSIGFAGQFAKNGGILLLTLEKPYRSILVASEIPLPIIYSQALDLHTQGWVDQLVAIDQKGGVWSVRPDQVRDGSVARKWGEAAELREPAVVASKSPQATSMNLFYIGHDVEGRKGVYKITLPLVNALEDRVHTQAVTLGEYAALWMRFGQLILLPKMALEKPLVFRIRGDNELEQVKYPWQASTIRLNNLRYARASDNADAQANANAQPSIESAVCLWDPQQNLDMILTYNNFFEVGCLTTDASRKKLGRMSWRRRH